MTAARPVLGHAVEGMPWLGTSLDRRPPPRITPKWWLKIQLHVLDVDAQVGY